MKKISLLFACLGLITASIAQEPVKRQDPVKIDPVAKPAPAPSAIPANPAPQEAKAPVKSATGPVKLTNRKQLKKANARKSDPVQPRVEVQKK